MITLFLACIISLSTAVPLSEAPAHDKCGYESCPKTDPDVLNIHIVAHTHDDVGWLKTVDQYYYGSRNNIQKAGVQYIIDSVVKELWEDPKRRFIYVETAFFWKWWVKQPKEVKHKVHVLVRQGRLQFVGGAWSMNDEAAIHYQSTVDQFTWGLSKLNETFGACGMPLVGWQIDPFGHAREFANNLAAMGYDALFLGRIDYQDKKARLLGKNMEMVWRGDDDIGKPSDIFTGILYNTYSPPPGFCFDVLCSDEPIIDDPNSPLYNVESRVNDFLEISRNMSDGYITNNILVTMGEDFQYQDAAMWYSNLDKLIQYTNLKAAKEGLNVKMFYSTPACYLKAVRDANPTLPTKQDDFFPYASDPTAYWTGYFTSRPTTKYFEREGNNYLQVAKQLQVLGNLDPHNIFVLNELKSAMGVMQHHDAVTGTEKQHVTHDYERLLDLAVQDSLIIPQQTLNQWAKGDQSEQPVLELKRCHFNESRCYTSENSEEFVVTVYNPVAWTLEAVPVRIPVTEGNYAVIAPNGQEITSQLVELPIQVTQIPTRDSKATHEIVFLAYNVPGMGYKAFYIKRNKSVVKRNVDIIKETIGADGKQKIHYYTNLNEYWKNIRDKTYIDLKNVNYDFGTLQEHSIFDENFIRIPDMPMEMHSSEFIQRSGDFDDENTNTKNIEMLRDPKDYNKDVDALESLIREAKSNLEIIAKRAHTKNNIALTNYPLLNDDEMRMLSDDPMIVERYPDDQYLENEHIKIRIDGNSGQITHFILPDGSESPLGIEMLYYPGCIGNNEIPANRSSGAYIFRPNATKPFELYRNDTKIVKGPVLQELQYTLADYASGVVRLYNHAKLNYIENEWLVGPIPIDDGIGKEVIVRYVTDIVNNGEFYTDSNGRQMLKRRLNQRPQWNVTLEEPIAGNYYPVTNKMYIEDTKRISVITDRSQGGSSLIEGNVELMLHRRLLHDDAFGVDEALNETAKGVGLIVRGKHTILLYKSSDKKAAIADKRKVLENHLQPTVFVSDAKHLGLTNWLTLKNKYGGILNDVPEGLHILSLEPWEEGKLLLRLENYLEKSDRNDATIEIDISAIFKNLKVKHVRETTLSGNRWMDEYEKWKWNTEDEFSKNFNENYGNIKYSHKASDEIKKTGDNGFTVKMIAKDIRTFVVEYEFVQ